MSVSPEERVQYSAIIDGILATSDLTTISAKAIRRGLAAALDVDISDKKQAVQELIMERFDKAQARSAVKNESDSEESPRKPTNGHTSSKISKPIKRENPTYSESPLTPSEDEEADSSSPRPKKKARKDPVTKKAVDDAKLAAILQAQENSRGRSTRGGGIKKQKPLKKKTPKRKSDKKVNADDDSDLEIGSNGEIKEKPKKGGFHKQYHLSAPLADLVGEATLSRPQVVKKIWQHIKANELQDPTDKRNILCDEKMQLVFKQDKVHMFTMNKLLGKQLYDVEE